MREGYPDRSCHYCQLQLNTFHAFIGKAKSASKTIEKMLKQFKQCDDSIEQHSETSIDGELEARASPEPEREPELEAEYQGKSLNNQLTTADDMEFDMELANDDELNDMEFIVSKREFKLIGENGVEVVEMGETEGEGLYLHYA